MSRDKNLKRELHRKVKKNDIRLQEFFEIKCINDNNLLKLYGDEIYYFRVSPVNLSVQSKSTISSLVSNLANVLIALKKCEFICLNSSQNYISNKKHLQSLEKTENNLSIKSIDSDDILYLNNIRAHMTTSRLFLIAVRLKTSLSCSEKKRAITNVMQICQENKFAVGLLDKQDIQKMLAIYLENNIYSETPDDFDGSKYIQDNDKYNLKDFVDLVCPSVVDFKHASYYIFGNTYRTAWAIRSYATTTKMQALLKALGEQDGVTLHIYNRLVMPAEQNKIFEQAENRNRFKLQTNKKAVDQVEGKENLSDLSKMIRKAHNDKELFMHCAVYIEMTADSLESLRTLSATVSQILSECRIVYDPLIIQQRDGFVSACPFGYNIFHSEFERVLPSSSVANLYPFSYSGKTDPSGLPIGKDVNGSYILTDFDMRAPDKTNGHISIFGNSGEGKSYLLKLLICLFRQQKKSVFTCDVDAEFMTLTERLGGTNLDMMSGQYYINILELKYVNSRNSDDDNIVLDDISAAKKSTLISQHIAYLRDFFKVYKPEITSTQLDILEIMLEKTYLKFHITNETDISKLRHNDYPLPSDLYKVVETELNIYDDNAQKGKEMLYKKDDCRNLLLAINSLCCGTDSRFFNGYTNIPNAEHINFIIKDMLCTNDNLKNAMYFNIFSFMQHKYFSVGNCVVALDEMHEIVKSRIVVDYIRSFIKRGRKKDSDIVIASQNIDDLMLPDIIEYTRPLFSIPTHRFLFYPGIVDTELFKRITNLKSSEFNVISRSKQGYCLYCAGDERYNLHVIAPPHKASLFGTAGGR